MGQRRSAAEEFADLDLKRKLGGKVDYKEELKALQVRFAIVQQAYLRSGDNAVVVFEGFDAAGKGGVIRRMGAAMDPRGFHVWPIAAPNPQELDHHYLQRFWTRLPGRREIAVFDRSWYGRVLVERVEGFASEPQWRRAYDEINAFEKMLADAGTKIAKVFLRIDPGEQLDRFEKRLEDPHKRWKLSADDFRNRDRWEEYREATEDMLARTDTEYAPWKVIAGTHKKYARVTALEAVVERLEAGVDLSPPPADPAIEKLFEAEKQKQKKNADE